jgi:hypothetical protein
MAQAHTLDNAGLTQHYQNLIAAGMDQSQSVTSPGLTAHALIAVADLLNAGVLREPSLTQTALSLMIGDISQVQNMDAASLTGHSIIAVRDLTHAQILDIVTYGGLIIGELAGEIVIYSMVAGDFEAYPHLSGTAHTLH